MKSKQWSNKESEIENDVKKRIRLEFAFMDLIDDEKENLRKEMLEIFQYDEEKNMRDNPWDARIIYHQDYKDMMYNSNVLTYLLMRIESGRELKFKTGEWLKWIK